MSNITLNLPDDILDEVRVVAAKRKTTVNAMVREFLTDVAKSEDRLSRVRARFRELAEKSKAEVGPITWKREDLYDR
jgi:plasmid stability protein